MTWNKYTIRTTVEAEELVSAMLMELGVEGLEINNGVPPTAAEFEEMYIDPQPELLPEDSLMDGCSEISFYLRIADGGEEAAAADDRHVTAAGGTSDSCIDDSYTIHDRVWTEAEADVLLEDIDRGMSEISQYANVGSATIEIGVSREDEWRDNWKAYYKPIFLSGILIKPEWEEIPAEYTDRVKSGEIAVIELNPGTAFGTGTHETTRLSIDALARYIADEDAVLDIGTGSGILGLAALSMGAGLVTATELDPACEHVIEENLELNNVDTDSFRLHIGNILEDETMKERVLKSAPQGYSIVLANILAPVIMKLAAAGRADSYTAEGGIFIATGIIDTKEQEVADCFRANPAWEIIEINHLNDWVSIVARRR